MAQCNSAGGTVGGAALTVLAHGVGDVTDLPLTLALAVVGAWWALTVSFVVLAFGSPRTAWAARLLGLGFTAYVAWAALFGEDLAVNPTLGVFYVYLWVGMVPVSLLLGNVWPLLSPLRSVHLVLCRPWGRLGGAGPTRDGALVVRNPLDNLDGTAVRPGLVAVLAVLLGSTVRQLHLVQLLARPDRSAGRA